LTGHLPVLTAEVIEQLQPGQGGVFVDCTVGLGGHSSALLAAGAGRIIGLDRDRDALDRARATLAPWLERVELVHADYRSLDAVLDGLGVRLVDGTLADLGVSSMQLEDPGRGFSFQRNEPLDMRMDRSGGETAADLLARSSEVELADAIFQYGEERYSRRIARALIDARRQAPIDTTGQLAAIVRRAIPRRGFMRLDPATRTFQAFRIWVNRELEGLDRFLEAASRRLRSGARLVVITFHSLEDRIVKHTLRSLAQPGVARLNVLTGNRSCPPRRSSSATHAPAVPSSGRPSACSPQNASHMEAFEYAIKKDVRNNPIVRQVDEARQRELWTSVAVAVLLVLVLLFSAWQHFELLRHGYKVEEMQRERAAQEDIGRQYRLEIETLRSLKRIEALATEELHLVAPSQGEAIVIERVLPADPPAKSVVARR
jgi:16S rRNA (cytosine1402-N4)-methyltransferase